MAAPRPSRTSDRRPPSPGAGEEGANIGACLAARTGVRTGPWRRWGSRSPAGEVPTGSCRRETTAPAVAKSTLGLAPTERETGFGSAERPGLPEKQNVPDGI